MATGFSRRHFQGTSRINLHQDWELRFWSDKWNVSRPELMDAVKRVGVQGRGAGAGQGLSPSGLSFGQLELDAPVAGIGLLRGGGVQGLELADARRPPAARRAGPG